MSATADWRAAAPLNLILDADDTLWDSNIHFLEAFDAFVEAILALGVDSHRDAIKAAVREAELELIQTHGYGRRPYVIALERAVINVAPELHHQPLRREVERIGSQLIERHCELLPGVGETVPELAARHRMILFTKGQRDEQMGKLERSGLAPYFSRVETPREKNPDSYRRLVIDAGLDRERTFMIGNSPRSDVNPALRAGLRAAIYIPHPQTWELEEEELDARDSRIIELPTFRALLRLF
ncbi:MAG TPA: HAD family hydrolase [Candidatus Binataceae bacterium]|nr:HAD family hydrolase [Candidatus Binataceae bacterium]